VRTPFQLPPGAIVAHAERVAFARDEFERRGPSRQRNPLGEAEAGNVNGSPSRSGVSSAGSTNFA
jgi:hypothetical protein